MGKAAEPEFQDAILRAKTSVVEALALHEAACLGRDGDHKCWQERINVVAFIAHALEMKPAQLISAAKELVKYNEGHDAGVHGHEE